MQSLNPHILFDGNAREALTYYQAVFGGELHFVTVGDQQNLGLPADAIFHSELKGGGFSLMAADTDEVNIAAKSDRFSLHVLCSDKSELEQVFHALSEGGSVHCEVGPAYGGLFAVTTDRYGVKWYLSSPN